MAGRPREGEARMRTPCSIWAIALIAAMAAAGANASQNAASQSSSTTKDSLAAASRRAREEQANQPKASKVYTNDNMPTNATINVVGSGRENSAPSAPASDAQKSGDAGQSGTPSPAKIAADKAALAAAKDHLATLQKDLDILQRKFGLDQQTYLSNPAHESDTASAAALRDEQSQIGAKQDEVETQQKLVASLQAAVDAAAANAT